MDSNKDKNTDSKTISIVNNGDKGTGSVPKKPIASKAYGQNNLKKASSPDDHNKTSGPDDRKKASVQGKSVKQKSHDAKKARNLILLIVLMLVLIVLACMWLMQRGVKLNSAKTEDAVKSTMIEADETAAGTLESIDGLAENFAAAQHVYSHRGKEGPEEHSFKVYDEAIAAGSIYIEQDLVLSNDDVLYVSHDLNAYAMTGKNAEYASMTAEQIDKLETKAGNKILRMSDVFDRYGRSVRYVIELKEADDTRMIKAFQSLVDEYGFADIVTAQSQDLNTLRRLEEVYPDMPKLYICKSEWGYDTSFMVDCIDIVCLQDWLVNKERVKKIHDSGRLCSAWTLDSEKQIRNAIDCGVDTYFTNDTPLAISLEKKYR